MNEYILLMYPASPDARDVSDPDAWARYLHHLRSTGLFDGGSAIGAGERLRKGEVGMPYDTALGGYIRLRATNLQDAKALLAGNPVFEDGGVVEIRELLRT